MANKFRKVSESLQFAKDKMKKNGFFETDRMFCDIIASNRVSRNPYTATRGRTRSTLFFKGKACFRLVTRRDTWRRMR